ncbi:MAG: DUF2851 family protein, partial [Dehalococcoidia bacterium]
SSQWYRHGHHIDPHYNNIMLHVVMWNDCEKPTTLQNGSTIPTLCLQPFVTGPLPEEQNRNKKERNVVSFSCAAAKLYSHSGPLVKKIEQAGGKRFHLKMDLFIHEIMKEEEAGRVLLRYIARALGYMSNMMPFERLAGLLVLNGLECCPGEDIRFLQSLILGTAGLLPSQRSGRNRENHIYREQDITGLESIWRILDIKYTMKEHEWCLYRVRPQNHPVRRQIALSLILERYRDSGLLNGLIEIFTNSHIDMLNHVLLNGLEVSCNGYWADHADFGVSLKHKTALLGNNKAGDIVVNVVLPFIASWAELHNDALSREKALNAYICFPRLAENHVTRHMREQIFHDRKVKMTACRQQGLIHLYRTYCRYRDCADCLINVEAAGR